MIKMKVNLKKNIDNSYNIIIGSGILQSLPVMAKEIVKTKQFVIITDSNVAKFHLEKVETSFDNENLKVLSYIFKAGGKNKSRKVKGKIEDFLLENDIDRSSCIIALGGGVTGDMAGFVAATYCRGIPFIQVPTTLLSQVDSSIGGKTGVDTPYAKNMIGAFYQPKLVLIDIDTLKTIPKSLSLNGIGEILKHAIILDRDLFELLENNVENIKKMMPDIMLKLVARNCDIKRGVVESDEKETGLRKILNFGHTIGHAVEVLSKYKISHDECVIIGMYYESLCANAIGFLDDNELKRIIILLKKFLPDLSIPKNINTDGIIKKTYLDKKVKNGIVNYVLPKKIGSVEYDVVVDEKIIRKALGMKEKK